MKGAIFDLDGTLLDSMSWWENFTLSYLRSLGKNLPPELEKRLATMSLVDGAKLLQQEFGVSVSIPELLAEIDRRADDFYRNHAPLKKGAAELLEKLHEQGVALCVATASNRGPAELALKRNGVLHLFSFMVTCTEEGVDKNSPDIYERALEKLGTPKEETFVFEDAPHAYKTAQKAGFPVVGVYDEYFGNQGFLKMEELAKQNF